MNKEYRHSLLAGVLAALVSMPTWAAEPAPADDNTQSEPVLIEEAAPAPMPETRPQLSTPQTAFATPEVLRLYNHSPDELDGQQVIGADGEVLGEISEIVSGRVSGHIYAVISRGGFFGIGASEYAVSFEDLRMEEGVLHMAVTEAELEMRKEYVEDRYVRVEPSNHPISEFSAFEEIPR